MKYFAVDLGGTRTKIGLVIDAKIEAFKIIDAEAFNGLLSHLKVIKKEILAIKDSTGINDIDYLGIAFPGLVNSDKGCVLSVSEKYADAASIDIVAWGKTELGLTVKLENDARLACLGEWKYGAGMGSSNMVMCTLGTGIGTSAIINNQILRGKHYQAGVLGGHFVIDYKDESNVCSCGNKGCAEAVASTRMIAKKAKEHHLFPNSLLKNEPIIDMENIFKNADKGDELAELLKEHCLYAWGITLVNLIHAYDPELIVIGGGISNAQKILLPYFKKIIVSKSWTPWGQPEIKIANYPDSAALLGVAHLFQNNNEK